ncbi:MAG: DUF58 domain-containing protein [Nitrospinales bacterium]
MPSETQRDSAPLFTFSLGARTLALTREGGGFVCLIFGVGLGAINTGNNLLYLVLAMCCSFIVVSGLLSELTLKRIVPAATTHKTIYAQERYPLNVRLFNGKKKFPSYSLRVELPPDPYTQSQTDRDLYFFHIPGGGSREKSVMFSANKRGLLQIKSCRLSTRYPFGFFIKSKTVPLDWQTTVFPTIRKAVLPTLDRSPLEGEGIVKSRGEEIYSLREFQPGDPAASVHWKSTAKTGALRVKEFIGGGRRSFTVFLNIKDPQTNRLIDPEALEKRVVEAASLVYHLIRRGDEVSLKTQDYHSPFGNSPAHLETLMSYLAFAGTESETEKEKTNVT